MLDASAVIQVAVPATSANLGPGFDVLGMALDFGLTARLQTAEQDDFLWQGHGKNPVSTEQIPPIAENLLFLAMDAVFAKIGMTRPPCAVHCRSEIPLARGLGSSAAAVLAGVLLANALSSDQLTPSELLTLATQLEGHPDNVVPAMVGGATAALLTDQGEVHFARIPLPEQLADLGWLLALPDLTFRTSTARQALPSDICHLDAAFNVGRVSLLILALVTGRWDLLTVALEDRLHQPYRIPLIKGMRDAMAAGRAAGAYGITLSGSGPSLLAWCPRKRMTEIGMAMQQAWGGDVTIRPVAIAPTGAQVSRILANKHRD